MSDNQGDRPDEQAAASTPQGEFASPTPDTGQPDSAPASAGQPDSAPASAVQPEPAPRSAVPADPAASIDADQFGTGRAGAGQVDSGRPAVPPPHPGYAPRADTYASGAPRSGGADPGSGDAFGIGAQHTQPTLPLSGGYGPAPTGPGFAGPAHAAPGATVAASQPRQKVGASRVVGLIVAAALVGGAAGLGGAYAGNQLFAPEQASTASGPQPVTVNDTDDVNQTTGIAAKVLPSVVTISASSGSSGGTGSGVVLTSDGYVVTNTHVVTLDGQAADATIRVTTSDGRVFDAEIVGTDPTYDLAVIKLIDAEDLTPIEFSDSDELNVGDETVALGAPLGLANTVTTGIISALNRSIRIASSAAPDLGDEPEEGAPEDDGQGGPFFFDFGQGEQPQQATSSISIAVIQTDAAINPGNSGGALVDTDGRLIGINVAIASAGGSSTGQSGSIGVGFSIPSDIVQRISDELIENGVATHGLLGANVQPAASVEDSDTTGAYIAEAVAGGAAAEAGLREGDVVTAFNGVPITDAVDLTAQVRGAAGGSEVTITYVRDGRTLEADVTLGTLQL